jgi:hypothetical protein
MGDAMLVVAAFVYGPGGSSKGLFSRQSFDRQLHETLGLTVFPSR